MAQPVSASLVRRAAPAFSADAVVGTDFAPCSLASLTADGHWAVLAFYPADWTFVCPTELQSFSDASATFLAHKCRVAVISTDNKHSHLAWIQHPRSKGGLGPMSIPVIADVTKAIARAYGVLVEDPADGMCGLALRGTFIISPSGVVRSVQVNDDSVGRNVDETLRLLQAFQYADEHGEVCPSKWKPGGATMVPKPKESQAYFSTVADAAAGSGAAAAAALGGH
jgi:alkyl hydroperoxide reductase subunit AhpC